MTDVEIIEFVRGIVLSIVDGHEEMPDDADGTDADAYYEDPHDTQETIDALRRILDVLEDRDEAKQKAT